MPRAAATLGAYPTHSVCTVVLQRSIPTQIRQLILCISSKGSLKTLGAHTAVDASASTAALATGRLPLKLNCVQKSGEQNVYTRRNNGRHQRKLSTPATVKCQLGYVPLCHVNWRWVIHKVYEPYSSPTHSTAGSGVGVASLPAMGWGGQGDGTRQGAPPRGCCLPRHHTPGVNYIKAFANVDFPCGVNSESLVCRGNHHSEIGVHRSGGWWQSST